ncbi:hypothetical protein HND97_16375 [Vibrio cholerae]|nr:hypothetical protein HND97_16375 [Vibrio cholerae]
MANNGEEGLKTRGVSSPNELWWLSLLCLSFELFVASPLGGRYAFEGNMWNIES